MTSDTTVHSPTRVLDSIRATTDALSVARVFGDPHQLDGVTIVPVARIGGGAGGGGGEGTGHDEAGSGFGTGFGVRAQPVGIYEIRDGDVRWRPTVDVTRIAKGAQVLAGIVTVCITLVALRRSRD